MSGDQKNLSDQADPSPSADDETAGANDASRKRYYYDDATGYEIYQDDQEDEGDESDEATATCSSRNPAPAAP